MTQQLLNAQQITKYFGAKLILNEITLSVNRTDRLALVGENGVGKSTLVKIAAGHLPADSGTIRIPEDTEIGYLPQETEVAEQQTIDQYLAQTVGRLDEIGREMRQLEAQMSHNPADLDPILERYGQLQETFEKRGGYDLDYRIDQVLEGLGLAQLERDRPLTTLSGGEKRRITLAGLLLRAPDLLLLDEPTNHLDFATLEWLETFLRQYDGGILLISHDRRFLNNVVNIIAELTPKQKEITFYHGNYDFYLQERERVYLQRVALYEEQQEEIKRLKVLMKQQAFVRGGGRAPSDGDKIQYKLRSETAQSTASKTIQNARKRLEELEETAIPQPTRRWAVNPEFEPAALTSQEVIRLKHLSKSFGGRTLFSDLTETIYNGDRVVFVAPNGTGKSTLIKLILTQLAPDSGQITIAPQAVVGYLDQEQSELDDDQTVLASFAEVTAGTESELRADLHRYALFEGDEVYQTVSTLSQGQRQKLQLARIAAQKANLLLLDEPTNHLDLASLERLEEAYRQFPGTILAVSHDRWFVDAVATKIWRLENGRIISSDASHNRP